MARNRMTLLELVQRVLDALGSDQVNSIDDTIESQQIAEEARVTYYEMMDRDEWPHLIQQTQLESVSDTDHPNYLKIPENIVEITDLRYETTESGDSNKTMKRIEYLSPQEFLNKLYTRNTSNSNVDQITGFDGIPLWIINDDPPMYWTTFDNEYIVFDSYDSAVDTTMQSSKSVIRAKVIPTWSDTDTFIPDMPDDMFSTYLAELTSAAFTYLKDSQSPKDEQRARRGMSKLRRAAAKVDERDRKVDYGRKHRRFHGSMDGREGSIRAAQDWWF